jgi:hypothetical protein
MSDQRTRKGRPGFFGNFNGTGNEKLVVRMHEQISDMRPCSAKATARQASNIQC